MTIILGFDNDDDPVVVVNGVEFPADGNCNCNCNGFWSSSGDALECEVTRASVEAAKAAVVLTPEQEARCLREAQRELAFQQGKAAVQEKWNADLPLWERHFVKGGGRRATYESSDGMGLRGGGVIPDSEWWEHPTRGKTHEKPEPVTVPVVQDLEEILALKRETEIHVWALAQAEADLWIRENWDNLSEELKAAIEAA